MDTISRAVPATVYRRMLSDFRRRLWAASEISEAPELDCPAEEMWAWFGIDPFPFRDPSAVREAVITARCKFNRTVGAAWRAAIRRDIHGRYPRLNIP